jgi:hypothetical protein
VVADVGARVVVAAAGRVLRGTGLGRVTAGAGPAAGAGAGVADAARVAEAHAVAAGGVVAGAAWELVVAVAA